MKALVKRKAEPGLWLEDVPMPEIGINDVLIEVFRTGICGTDVHIYQWDEWARKTVPVPLVVGHEFAGRIVELGGNDILRGLPPQESRKNLDGILESVAEKGLPILLVGMKAPQNYGADYEVQFNAIYPDLAEKYDALLFPEYLSPILDGRTMTEALATFMQADGIHPDKNGVALIVEVLGPLVADLAARAN